MYTVYGQTQLNITLTAKISNIIVTAGLSFYTGVNARPLFV
jgi:hypothetical protein